MSGWDKCIFKNIDVSFPIQPSFRLGEKSNAFCINASPHYDPTISMFHCWTQSSINSSPAILLTYTLPSLLCKRNLDSSLKITWDHCSAVQSLWARVNSRRAYLCRAVRRGFFLSLRPMCPASLSLLRVVGVDTLTPCSSCIFAFISGVFFLFRPGILRSCTLPIIRFFSFKISQTVLWLQPARTAISRCE